MGGDGDWNEGVDVLLGDVLNALRDGNGAACFHRVGNIVECLNSRRWCINN